MLVAKPVQRVGGFNRAHDYDSANVLTATTYPTANGGTAKQVYKIDDHGRRTDTWLGAPANATPDAAGVATTS